jgi:hypothetical protein
MAGPGIDDLHQTGSRLKGAKKRQPVIGFEEESQIGDIAARANEVAFLKFFAHMGFLSGIPGDGSGYE